jgi:hypothetical protein
VTEISCGTYGSSGPSDLVVSERAEVVRGLELAVPDDVRSRE